LSGRADLSSRPPQNPIPPNGLSNRLNRLLTLSGFTVKKNAIAITLRTGKLYPGLLPRNYPIARNRPFRVVHKGESASPAGTMPVQPKNFNRRDQRAVCCGPRAVRRPCPPLDAAHSASQIARSSRACMVQDRSSGGLPSVARRRALRSGFVPLGAPLRLRSTCPARRPQTEA
jgi:hypothetical protein